MASNQTPNLQLSQWEADDEVLRADFNADNAKIDAAVAEAKTAAATAQSAADAAAAAVRTAETSLLAYCGNCIVVAGTYTGTGTYGSTRPCKLTFPYKPMLVLLEEDFLLRQGVEATKVPFGVEVQRLEVRWSGNTVSWYSYNGSAQYQCNANGMTYHYVAFLAREEDPNVGKFTAS